MWINWMNLKMFKIGPHVCFNCMPFCTTKNHHTNHTQFSLIICQVNIERWSESEYTRASLDLHKNVWILCINRLKYAIAICMLFCYYLITIHWYDTTQPHICLSFASCVDRMKKKITAKCSAYILDCNCVCEHKPDP